MAFINRFHRAQLYYRLELIVMKRHWEKQPAFLFLSLLLVQAGGFPLLLGQPAQAAPAGAPPIITVTGTCDGAGNSVFTITNTGGAMTTNYTWEIYQNSVFLTSGVFMLTASPGPGNSQ